jgi:hypothetical protein
MAHSLGRVQSWLALLLLVLWQGSISWWNYIKEQSHSPHGQGVKERERGGN